MNSPKNAFYTLLGIVGLGIAAGAGIFYYYNSQLSDLNDDVSKLMAEQQAIGQQVSSYERAERQLEELSAVQELVDSVLPDSKEQANLVAELKKFIVDSGLQFDSVTFSGSELGSGGLDVSQTQAQSGLAGVRVLPVTAVIQAGASFDQVTTLLQKIETNRRKMQVTDISLTPEKDSDLFSSISMQINVFVQTGAPAAAATDAATPEPGAGLE